MNTYKNTYEGVCIVLKLAPKIFDLKNAFANYIHRKICCRYTTIDKDEMPRPF